MDELFKWGFEKGLVRHKTDPTTCLLVTGYTANPPGDTPLMEVTWMANGEYHTARMLATELLPWPE